MKSFRGRWLALVFVISTSCIAFYTAAIALAEPVMRVESPTRPADIIIVLGGDGIARGLHAGDLFARGLAPRILVTGDGDCRDIKSILVKSGVPRERIETECQSRNTWENAGLSAPFLRRRGVERAILVTSWFHSRCAMTCFQSAAPGVLFLSSPTGQAAPLPQRLGIDRGAEVMYEYLKLAWYAVRYGILLPLLQAPGPAA